jgi:hypothetical protein
VPCAIVGGSRAMVLIYVKDTSERYADPAALCSGSAVKGASGNKR